jgi:hypothetical protein
MIVLKKVTVCGQTWTETEEVDAPWEKRRRANTANNPSDTPRHSVQTDSLRVSHDQNIRLNVGQSISSTRSKARA